jgi:hypothetical protein
MANAINSIIIKDFLVFQGQLKMDFCPGINLFIGGNGCGKTTLLKALYAGYESCFAGRGLEELVEDYIGSATDFHSDSIEVVPNDDVVNAEFDMPGKYYIPEKDILEHAKGLLTFIEQKQTGFSSIYKNVLVNAFDIPTKAQSSVQKSICQKISKIIGGTVVWEQSEGTFYTIRTDGKKIPFSNEASGFKKLGYLGLLVASGQLSPGSILFWDEPENSLNPEIIPKFVDILLELQRNEVQIFIATHSYDIARWFELNKEAQNTLRYFNLRKSGDAITADVADDYETLPNSIIEDAGDALLKRVTEIAARNAGVMLK